MPSDFDPYHKWLGIPPNEQPPNHYRLLGIQLFEDDADVVAEAADQRMVHLRTHQSGKHSSLTQKLLNEVSAARICLLKLEKKKSYDEALKQKLSTSPTSPEAPQSSQELAAPTTELTPELPKIAAKSTAYRQHHQQREKPAKLPLILVATALVTVVFAVVTIAIVLSSEESEPANVDDQSKVAEKAENQDRDTESQLAKHEASRPPESKTTYSTKVEDVEEEPLTEEKPDTPNTSESDSPPVSDATNVKTSSPKTLPETTTESSDAAPARNAAPRSLIVGTEPNQLTKLDKALEIAKPGDTIEIRHPGPLEFSPVDLTGKTPLTIIGGKTDDDTDYWPLLRVRTASSGEQPVRAIFYGDDLQLDLKEIHLAVGGQAESIFGLRSGRVEIENCTLTVGNTAAYWEAPSGPMALLKTSQPSSHIELVVKHSLLRGSRLHSCAVLDGPKNVHISVDQTIWAGGRAPLIAATEIQDVLQLNLQSCTLYNLVNALRWEASDRQSQDSPSVNAVVENAIFVGAKLSSEPLIIWNPKDSGDDVSKATEEGRFMWKGMNNVYHRFPAFFRKRNSHQIQDVTSWTRHLLKQSGSGIARVANPFFSIQPDGVELDFVQASDFSPRFVQDRVLSQRVRDQSIGADESQLLYSPILALREPATETPVGEPRRPPRILKVNQKNGPLKTLKEAFRELRDGDIIEITDSETYTPSRDYLVEPARGILVSPVNNFTVRSAKNAEPIIILRDDVHNGRPPNSELFLFHVPKGNLVLDGLHFRIGTSVRTPRAITLCEEADFFRATNCTVVELSRGRGIPGPPGTNFSSSETLAFHFGSRTDGCLKWLENSVFISQGGPGYFLGGNPTGEGGHLLILRNCLFRGNCSYWAERPRFVLRMESSSIFGRVASLHHSCSLFSTSCSDNLVVSKGSIFGLHPYVIGRGEKRGARNAVWTGTRPSSANERNTGSLAFIPGPILPYPPQPDGRSTASSPYRSFELNEKQPAAKMSYDGGPVGFRSEYLPKLPSLPKTFFQ